MTDPTPLPDDHDPVADPEFPRIGEYDPDAQPAFPDGWGDEPTEGTPAAFGPGADAPTDDTEAQP